VVKLGARRAPSLTQLLGRDTHALCGPCLMRSRVGTHRSGAQHSRDALFKGRNIQELSVRDTSVGDTSTLHPLVVALGNLFLKLEIFLHRAFPGSCEFGLVSNTGIPCPVNLSTGSTGFFIHELIHTFFGTNSVGTFCSPHPNNGTLQT
jgi:hypothetical protein